jgi:hypothetical protein
MQSFCPHLSTTETFLAKAASLTIVLLLFYPALALAQDTPGRFEVGGSVTAIRNAFLPSNVGPGLEGDLNIGRHFALDAAVTWLPSTSHAGQTVVGLFGAKVGTRTDHFGFFAKVRPGFVTMDNALRASTLVFPAPFGVSRFDRLTHRALDVGGVMEYYPARHWALRWDAGDTLFFEEQGPIFTIIAPNVVASFPQTPARTTNHFQFSTSLHYRF